MEKYLSHLSAAKLWNIPYIDAVIGHRANTNNDMDEITVSQNRARFRTRRKIVHSCELDLPAGAIVSRNGMMVASPELLFLELASELSIHRLILLGLQLCSHKPGEPHKAITTKKKLETFLADTSGYRGHRKAIRALKYVENGSASIMESLVYMILALPNNLGGYGLNGAALNQKIEIVKKVKSHTDKDFLHVDLFFKTARVAVEYESFAFHKSPLEQGKDARRSDVLERQGISVMKMSTIQLYDRDACRLFAHNLAARLNKRISIRTKSFDENHSLLRKLLPDRKPVSV